jgi:hypothetical protein
MSLQFEEYLLHLTLQAAENYNFEVTTKRDGSYFRIKIDFTNTCYIVDNKLIESIEEELLNTYTNIAGFPTKNISSGTDYACKTLLFSFYR